MKAAIVGLAGPVLSGPEADMLRAHPPAGIILFGRNVQDPGQLAALMRQARAVLPENAVYMVDQEGGRVARLRPPHWHGHLPAARLGGVHDTDPEAARRAAWITGALIGHDCAAAGFTVVAAPVLDLAMPGAHDVIGDRAFSSAPSVVAELGRALANGLLAAGVQPVVKHVPGHGRARVDSHVSLPVVDEAALDDDTTPFARNADLPWMMTAHIVYTSLDAHHPATCSPVVIRDIIRGRIGFQGVLVTDDLAMNALTGSPTSRALAALRAGCDLALYCAGDLDATAALLEACPDVTPAAAARLASARAMAASARRTINPVTLLQERDRLLA